MAGPFPGMDPYLENPARWPDVHQGLISAMRASLNALLPPGYVASMGERCQVIPTGRSIYPDVLLRQRPTIAAAGQHQGSLSTTLAAPDPPLILEELPLEPGEPYIEILSMVDQRRVVTAIEVLSPGNKEAGSEGRSRYQQKQQELLASRTHLIEIDLLRAGLYTVAAPHPQVPCHYLVSLHRGGEGRRFAVWPNTLHERLPPNVKRAFARFHVTDYEQGNDSGKSRRTGKRSVARRERRRLRSARRGRVGAASQTGVRCVSQPATHRRRRGSGRDWCTPLIGCNGR